jgi:methyltransferase-like protein/SAM-dependent methyltransferase
MVNPRAASYELVPYENLTFYDAHPSRLAVMAALFGRTPPAVERARVLELGCAGGGNLLPMALALPEGQFTGLDLSPRQIAEARALADRLGLKNVALHARSFTDLPRDIGEFDYIIAHGLYSWIAPPLQDALLAAVRTHLAPEGVAFVSFNTYPGWHTRGMVRDLMVYHIRDVAAPAECVRQARAILEGLAQILGDAEGGYARLINEEHARVRTQSDPYLLHDYLEAENNPESFHEFVAKASAKGLQYIADAQFRTLAENQPAPVRAVLDRLAGDDLIAREQYLDFLCDRHLRCAVLGRAGVPTQRTAAPEALGTLRVATLNGPAAPGPDPFAAEVVEFRSADGRSVVKTGEALPKLTMRILTERWPRSVPFEELRRTIHDRLAADSRALGEAVLRLHAANIVDLYAHEPAFVTELSERPTASPMARLQAEAGARTTNLRHRVVELGAFESLVLRQLDGRRDRSALLDALVEAASSGRFQLHHDGQPITDQPKLREIFEKSLGPCLQGLANSALLVG